jgi:hypothetical protein
MLILVEVPGQRWRRSLCARLPIILNGRPPPQGVAVAPECGRSGPDDPMRVERTSMSGSRGLLPHHPRSSCVARESAGPWCVGPHHCSGGFAALGVPVPLRWGPEGMFSWRWTSLNSSTTYWEGAEEDAELEGDEGSYRTCGVGPLSGKPRL